MNERFSRWTETAVLHLLAPVVVLTSGPSPSRLAVAAETVVFTTVLCAVGAVGSPVLREWSLAAAAVWFGGFAAALAWTVLAGSRLVRFGWARYRRQHRNDEGVQR